MNVPQKKRRLVKHRHHALLTEINDVLFKPLSFSDVIRGTYSKPSMYSHVLTY